MDHLAHKLFCASGEGVQILVDVLPKPRHPPILQVGFANLSSFAFLQLRRLALPVLLSGRPCRPSRLCHEAIEATPEATRIGASASRMRGLPWILALGQAGFRDRATSHARSMGGSDANRCGPIVEHESGDRAWWGNRFGR